MWDDKQVLASRCDRHGLGKPVNLGDMLRIWGRLENKYGIEKEVCSLILTVYPPKLRVVDRKGLPRQDVEECQR